MVSIELAPSNCAAQDDVEADLVCDLVDRSQPSVHLDELLEIFQLE